MRFILIDRVDALEPAGRAVGVKAISLSDPVFVDHFPDHPVYPGSLLVESMAQLGGLLVEATWQHEQTRMDDDRTTPRRAMLMQVDRAKFHHPCRPGEVLCVVCDWVSMLGHAAQVRASVGGAAGDELASAQLTFMLVAVESPALHAHRRSLYRQWTSHWPQSPAWCR